MKTLRTSSVLLSIGFGLAAGGCGSADPDSPPSPVPPPRTEAVGPLSSGTFGEKVTVPIRCNAKPPDPSRTRVMVVDSGFDLRHPVFQGKVAGCYRIECPPPRPFEYPPGESDDETAARLIASLGAGSPACTLHEGFDIEVDSWIEQMDPRSKKEWNDALFNKGSISRKWTGEIMGPFFDATMTVDYHGTMTAGTVAFQNDVDIVAVKIQFSDPNDDHSDEPCDLQPEIDRRVRLLSRPDVAAAYAKAPLDPQEQILVDLRRLHGIAIENHSYGQYATEELEQLRARQCGVVSYDEEARMNGELERARFATQLARGDFAGTDTLIWQAAGNNGLRVTDPSDSADCTPWRTDHALVGAYEFFRGHAVITSFSTFGDCVDIYALGADVIAPTVGGLYTWVSGTSLSAPITTRYASSQRSAEDTAVTLREKTLAARDTHRFLPLDLILSELSRTSLEKIEGQSTAALVAPRQALPRRTAPRRAAVYGAPVQR